jgi:SNF2 family DNA or RNA helicase
LSEEIPFTPVFPPLKHQAEFLAVAARRASYALFWEQGTGKTKALIDNVAMLLVEQEIDAVFVLAPNGVHRNWYVEELPKHWPKDVPAYEAFCWDTEKANNKSFQAAWKRFLSLSPPCAVLCMSYDALMTDAGKRASWDFIRSRKFMYIGDESQRFKTPDTSRTKRVIASSVYAKYRRIASGTPMDTPFDIYSQVRFLDAHWWVRSFSVGGFTAFKNRFANIIKIKTNEGREFPKIQSYRDLDQLEENLKEIGSRVTKDEALDLPPKTYKRMFHELTNSQRTAYEQLKSETMTFLESGELITADMAMNLHNKLTQIGCGFIIPEAGQAAIPFAPNPRARLLQTILEDLYRPAIIWGRYTFDCQLAAQVAKAAKLRTAIFDGTKPHLSIDAFHEGKVDVLIANIDSNMREGFTLNEADTTIYYSNSPKLLNRLQSEDRNHRIGQANHVTYIDLLAERTLDAKTLRDLKEKRDVTGSILGDKQETLRAWLMEALSDE